MIHQKSAMINQDKILDRWHPVFDLSALTNTNLSGRYFIPDLNKLTTETNKVNKEFEPFAKLPALYIDNDVAKKGTFGILDVKIQSVLEDNLSELNWRDTRYASDYPTGRKYIRGIKSTDNISGNPIDNNEYFGISGKENYSILGFSRKSSGIYRSYYTADNEKFIYNIIGASTKYAEYTSGNEDIFAGTHSTDDVVNNHIFKDTRDGRTNKSKVHSLIVKYTLYTSDGNICHCNFKVDDIVLYFYYGYNRIRNNMTLESTFNEGDVPYMDANGEAGYKSGYIYELDSFANYNKSFFDRYKMESNPINNHYNDTFRSNYFPSVGDTTIKRFPYMDIFLANSSYVKESLLVDINEEYLNYDTDIIYKEDIPYTPEDYLTDDPIKMCQLIYHTGYSSTFWMDLMEAPGEIEFGDVTLIQQRFAYLTNRMSNLDSYTDKNSIINKFKKLKALLIAGNKLYVRFCKKYNLEDGIDNNTIREKYKEIIGKSDTRITNPAKDDEYFSPLIGDSIINPGGYYVGRASNEYSNKVKKFVQDLASKPRLCLFFKSSITDRDDVSYYNLEGIKKNFINKEEILNKEGIYNFDRDKIITRAIYKAPERYSKISPMGVLWDNVYLHTATHNQGSNTSSEPIYGEYSRITGNLDFAWFKACPTRMDTFTPANYWREYEGSGINEGKVYIGDFNQMYNFKINDFGNQNVYYFHQDLRSINYEYRRGGSYFHHLLRGPYVKIEPIFTGNINNNIPYYDTHGVYYNKNYSNDAYYKNTYNFQNAYGTNDIDKITATGWYYPTTDYATTLLLHYPCVDWYTYPWASKSNYPDRTTGNGIFKNLGRYKYIYARRIQDTPNMYSSLSKFNFLTLRNANDTLGSANLNLDSKRWHNFYKYENNTITLDERYGLFVNHRLTK